MFLEQWMVSSGVLGGGRKNYQAHSMETPRRRKIVYSSHDDAGRCGSVLSDSSPVCPFASGFRGS